MKYLQKRETCMILFCNNLNTPYTHYYMICQCPTAGVWYLASGIPDITIHDIVWKMSAFFWPSASVPAALNDT